MSHQDRVIVLVDMDCFYCQVEEKLNPALKGKPVAVVQYNAWRGGGIIAVNYEAKERGVTRHMRGDEARRKCPDIQLVRVPTIRGKADLTKYRDAGKTVAKVLQTFTPLLERASVDEAYLDITEIVKERLTNATKEITLGQLKNTQVVGCDRMDFVYNLYNSGLYVESNLKLAFGGVLVEEIRAAIYQQTGYTCSAGIAHNKVLAKLACGLHKPNKQTILPHDSIQGLFENLPVQKIRSLGGKFGNSLLEDLGIRFMGELKKFTEKELRKRYDEKTASWLYNIARGIDLEPVTTRLVSKSIGCCKQFSGKAALIEVNSVIHWLNELASEIVERLEKDLEENNRKAKQMIISFSQEVNGKDVASSRTHILSSYDAKKIASDAYEVVKKNCMKSSGTFCLKFLGISTGKFEDCRNINAITSFFKVGDCSKNNLREDCGASNNSKTNDKAKCYSIASYFNNAVGNKTCAVVPEPEQSYSNESDVQNGSISQKTNFTDTTIEVDENSSEIIFFNENTTESGNTSDSDSITNELCNEDSNQSNENEPQKGSFFLRYFENLKTQERTSPVLRDFDTSRVLEEIEDEEGNNSDNSINGNDEEQHGSEDSANLMQNFDQNVQVVPGTSRDVFEFEDAMETCEECKQRVLKSEMIAHTDHHLALKIVREESHLYNTKPQITKQAKESTKKSKSGKRKSSNGDKNMTLEMFLKNTNESNVSEENTELCPQCNKRIDVASFESHLDYHTAKKNTFRNKFYEYVFSYKFKKEEHE